mgnify:CR=1 FL=1
MSKNKYSDEEIIEIFKNFAKELDRTPTQKDIQNKREQDEGFITNEVIQYRFKGLTNLIKICGLKANVNFYTKEEALKLLKNFYNKYGFVPKQKEFKNYADELPSVAVYDKFGGLLKALEIAEIPLRKDQLSQKNKNKLNKEQVKQKIIDFYNLNHFVPYTKDLDKYKLPKISTITHMFGNYKNYIIECGLEPPEEIFISTYRYTDDELLHILKDYYEHIEFPTERKFLRRLGLPSGKTYFDRFGSFSNALKMAEISIPENRKRYFDRQALSDKELLYLLEYYTNKKLENKIYLLTNDDIDNISEMPSSATYTNRFGGVVQSYELIGIDYYDFNNFMLEEDMKSKYKKLKKQLKHVPNSRDIDKASKQGLCYAMSSYIHHFNNLSDFQKSMNDIPTKLGKSISEKEALNVLIELSKELNRVPMQLDVIKCKYTPSPQYYSEHFGSLTLALNKVGLDNSRKIYKIPNTNLIALSFYEYKFMIMMLNKQIKFEKEIFYDKYINNFDKKYRFDFMINYKNQNIFIEIFGITGDNKYDNKTKEKIKLCKDNNLTLVEIYPKDFKQFDEDFLYKLLINKLNEKGIDE